MTSTVPPYRVLICNAPTCSAKACAAGALPLGSVCAAPAVDDAVQPLLTLAQQLLSELALTSVATVHPQSCFGRCASGPNMLIREVLSAEAVLRGVLPRTALYVSLTSDIMREIFLSHLGAGEICSAYTEDHLRERLVALRIRAPHGKPGRKP